MSAAFASRSSQRGSVASAAAPDVGHYDPHSTNTIAAHAAKLSNRKSVGAFGSSVRELNWGKGATAAHDGEATSAETASVPSSFGGADSARIRKKGPSAAMGGGSRFAPAKAASSGDHYVPPALGASKSYNSNRRTTVLGTMGSSRRFTEVKVSAPGDYSDARPGAFSSTPKKGKQNTGFGGTSSRVTAFGAAAKRAEESASAHLSYDVNTSAFARASEAATGTSAAFASKSTQRAAVHAPEGPSAQAYNTASVGSVAANANKSFNKSLQSGSGGFGTSAKRGGDFNTRPTDVPGPGEYAPDVVDVSDGHRPSSAFASTTRKGETHVRASDAPSSVDYDAHKADGMAAVATKSFNKRAGTGSFGPRAARQTHDTKDTPGPGEYTQADPTRPTVDSTLRATKGKTSGAFASTTLREVQWNSNNSGGGAGGAHSSFLP